MVAKPRKASPAEPPALTPYIARSVRAWAEGKAGEAQQKRLLNWLVKDVAGIGNLSMVPGDTHATAFLEGRRFVGLVLVNALEVKPDSLTEKADNE